MMTVRFGPEFQPLWSYSLTRLRLKDTAGFIAVVEVTNDKNGLSTGARAAPITHAKRGGG
jgi:hypothetical protein